MYSKKKITRKDFEQFLSSLNLLEHWDNAGIKQHLSMFEFNEISNVMYAEISPKRWVRSVFDWDASTPLLWSIVNQLWQLYISDYFIEFNCDEKR